MDIPGKFFKLIRRYALFIYSLITTYLTKIIMVLKGIKISKGLQIWGIPILVRYHKSKIIIGNHCSLRSNTFSNLVGVNRKCAISTLREGAEIKIGDNSGFSGTVIAAAGKITIGNKVLCGANTTITDFDWHGIEPDKRHLAPEHLEVVIEDNVWLGLNSVVLKGVTIGENSVIGANSLVIKDIPANVIAAGNPCKVIKVLK